MKQRFALYRKEDEASVAPRLIIASSYLRRLVGLWGRQALAEDEGILLVPCGSVHTFWMRFAIDVIALDKESQILDVRLNVPPGRLLSLPRGTHAVVEMAAGTSRVAPGERLYLKGENNAPLPRALRFLAER